MERIVARIYHPQVAVRLPPDIKAFIKKEALENASSQNSEIVRAIRSRMEIKLAVMNAAAKAAHDEVRTLLPDRDGGTK
jgi:hypothetical protein